MTFTLKFKFNNTVTDPDAITRTGIWFWIFVPCGITGLGGISTGSNKHKAVIFDGSKIKVKKTENNRIKHSPFKNALTIPWFPEECADKA